MIDSLLTLVLVLQHNKERGFVLYIVSSNAVKKLYLGTVRIPSVTPDVLADVTCRLVVLVCCPVILLKVIFFLVGWGE